VPTDGVEKKSNNGIKQDFEETDYEVDIVIKKIYKKSLKTVFFRATDVFMCAPRTQKRTGENLNFDKL